VETRLCLGPRTLRVSVAPDGDGLAVAVDDAGHAVRRIATGPRSAVARGTSEDVTLDIDGRPTRAVVAHVRERGTQRVLVALRGRVYGFEIADEARGEHVAVGSGTVTAPMPGKIVAVLVAVGDVFTAGQPLVILEAMKMESTLAAEIPGRVRTVAAVGGATVTAGDVLVEIAPAGE